VDRLDGGDADVGEDGGSPWGKRVSMARMQSGYDCSSRLPGTSDSSRGAQNVGRQSDRACKCLGRLGKNGEAMVAMKGCGGGARVWVGSGVPFIASRRPGSMCGRAWP
jgi:hypothetical protein